MVRKKKTVRKTKTTAKAKKKTTAKKTKTTTTKKKVTTRSSARVDLAMPVSKVAQKTKKARTKSEIFGILAESSGFSKKEIAALFENLQELINMDLSSRGPGIFNFPGLMKIVRVKKAATKARKGINPFTKEPMMFKAKPARNVIKIRAMKGLKEMV
ncbi:MAG: HU family DNA-binding protein [Deltaproteobacteria bacterium]|nr:HU family DNA-binding protein [Deltaproteobacteria bacterium]